VVAHAATLSEAAQKAYRIIPTIQFEGMHYRRDIGYRQLKRNAGK